MIQPIGEVLTLFISQKETSKRLSPNQITLDSKGIISNKFYDGDINRSVLLASSDSYTLAKLNGITLNHGELGENILIDYNPYHLPPHSRLKIGDVIMEISQLCTLCNHLSVIDSKLPKLLKNDRGIFARVIEPGTISIGDPISLLA